jgi:hypothetical protein
MEEIELRQSPGRIMNGDAVPTILNELFESYTVEEMNEILLNTLYRAIANPDQDITRQEFSESVHLITQITETFRKIQLEMPNLN